MNLDTAIMNSMATLQRAQTQQIATMAQDRYNVAPSLPAFPVDTVSFGSTPQDLGLIPDPRRMGMDSIPLSSDPNYLQKRDAYYDEVLRQIMTLKALENAQGTKKDSEGAKASKGDLNVVAGGRNDGLKAKKVTIHKHRDWSTRQNSYNVADYNKHESKFENAKVGDYYQVNVEWEDGSITTRDVQMESPGQTVYIDTAY